VHLEHPAYVWDFALYWDVFKTYGGWFRSAPLEAAVDAVQKIYLADYNPAAILPLVPFEIMFGDGRTVYIIAIAIMYVLPAAAVAAALAARVAGIPLTISLYIVCATTPALWMPSLRGQPDIVGLIFLGAATLILFKSDFLSRRPILFGILIGAFTYAPFMLRRWYAYSVVLFFLLAFLFSVLKAFSTTRSYTSILTPALGLSIATITFISLLYTLQYDLVVRVINTSYSELYVAYQTDFAAHLSQLVQRSSYLALSLTVVGLAIAVTRMNVEALFCVLAALGTFFFFIQTQYMGIHHALPIDLWLLPILVLGVRWLCIRIKLPLAAFAAMSTAALCIAASPLVRQQGGWTNLFIPSYDMSPLHLSNFEGYQRLTEDLLKVTGSGERYVIYASSVALSDSLVIALEPKLKSQVIFAPHIAAVQGFPLDLFDADYAVVATPDQSHQAPGSQENILTPGRWILRGIGFGAAFERLNAYTLESGAKAFLYRRTRAISEDEKLNLLAELASRYPDSPEIFAPPTGTTK
jgi:hypothetical protein